jgi:hypothetical protein
MLRAGQGREENTLVPIVMLCHCCKTGANRGVRSLGRTSDVGDVEVGCEDANEWDEVCPRARSQRAQSRYGSCVERCWFKLEARPELAIIQPKIYQ